MKRCTILVALLLVSTLSLTAPGNDTAPLTPRQLGSLIAYTRLFGYVRHFYPGDSAAHTDWGAAAAAGARLVESAESSGELADRLQRFFGDIAPGVQVYLDGQEPPEPAGMLPPDGLHGVRLVSWRHQGFGLGGFDTIYRSERKYRALHAGRIPHGMRDPNVPFQADLGSGIRCRVPITLYADSHGTYPRDGMPFQAPAGTDAMGRGARLGDVVIAWNILQQFYPYFDVVQTDWPAALRAALSTAATDTDAPAYSDTLRRLVSALHDGHGAVYGPDGRGFVPPIVWRLVENQLVVAALPPGATSGVHLGDVVAAIDGVDCGTLLKAQQELVSGATPQWIDWREASELTSGAAGSSMILTVHRRGAVELEIRCVRSVPIAQMSSDPAFREQRPANYSEIRPGVRYVDVTAVKSEELEQALPELAAAKAVICDLRGYPSADAVRLLPHLATAPITSAFWKIPVITRPDHRAVGYITSRWPLEPPASPHIGGRIAFLTDGRAISYAESVMGIVEHYHLGVIVGATTAGTDGNIDPFRLPGGYTIVFTGMKVLKHDGSRHHGVGIKPDIPVSPTIAGITAGRDEVLERALEAVSK